MDEYTWIPVEAREAAEKFRLAMRRDRHSHSATVRMIRAIVDHARVVRLRCDARAHMNRLSGTAPADVNGISVRWDASSSADRTVHALARFTADMTRRDLQPWDALTWSEEGEAISDAGLDLLSALIVDVEAGHG